MKIAAYNYIDASYTKFKWDKLFISPGGFCIKKVHDLDILFSLKLLKNNGVYTK